LWESGSHRQAFGGRPLHLELFECGLVGNAARFGAVKMDVHEPLLASRSLTDPNVLARDEFAAQRTFVEVSRIAERTFYRAARATAGFQP
jgi:hypothetical protein